jgi:hypothetical protein
MPREIARRSLCSRASYSASLFEIFQKICKTYLSCSPYGEINSTPAPTPSSLSESSKYIT